MPLIREPAGKLIWKGPEGTAVSKDRCQICNIAFHIHKTKDHGFKAPGQLTIEEAFSFAPQIEAKKGLLKTSRESLALEIVKLLVDTIKGQGKHSFSYTEIKTALKIPYRRRQSFINALKYGIARGWFDKNEGGFYELGAMEVTAKINERPGDRI